FFAFTFTEQLLPPFLNERKFWFESCHHFSGIAFHVKLVTDGCVLQCRIFIRIRVVVQFFSIGCSSDQLADGIASRRNRHQSDSSENRIAAAYICRHHKAFIAIFFSKCQQCAFFSISCDDDPFSCFRAVTFFHIILQETESNSGLCRFS